MMSQLSKSLTLFGPRLAALPRVILVTYGRVVRYVGLALFMLLAGYLAALLLFTDLVAPLETAAPRIPQLKSAELEVITELMADRRRQRESGFPITSGSFFDITTN